MTFANSTRSYSTVTTVDLPRRPGQVRLGAGSGRTDGVAKATAVAITASGRRIIVAVDGETLSTNVTAPLFDAG